MVIFHSYVKLPEGNDEGVDNFYPVHISVFIFAGNNQLKSPG